MKKKLLISAVLFLSSKNFAAINRERQALPIKDVLVAVIDTGTDIRHKALQDFIWVNQGEAGKDRFGRDKATNNRDDDDNGFVDDVHGWNFVDKNNDVSDQIGHGTHISGIIKTEFNGRAPSNIAGKLQLMILKYYDAKSSDLDNINNTVSAINYAARMGARLVNYSGGGSQPSEPERQAIANALTAGIAFIAAAGNNRSDTDFQKYYPANYALENIISVAATNSDGALESFSNFGKKSVDLAAPGKSIYSTLPDNSYGFLSGTSQATAFVTGAAARLVADSAAPISPRKLLEELLAGSRFNKSLLGKTRFQLAMAGSSN